MRNNILWKLERRFPHKQEWEDYGQNHSKGRFPIKKWDILWLNPFWYKGACQREEDLVRGTMFFLQIKFGRTQMTTSRYNTSGLMNCLQILRFRMKTYLWKWLQPIRWGGQYRDPYIRTGHEISSRVMDYTSIPDYIVLCMHGTTVLEMMSHSKVYTVICMSERGMENVSNKLIAVWS